MLGLAVATSVEDEDDRLFAFDSPTATKDAAPGVDDDAATAAASKLILELEFVLEALRSSSASYLVVIAL